MHPDLVPLLELQNRDMALLEADQALDLVLADFEALDAETEAAEQAVEQARRAVADAQRRRGEVEVKVENYRKLEERGRQRLDQVKTQKEQQAVMVELDLARSVLGKEEGDWLRLADTITALERAAQEAELRLEELKQNQLVARAELEERRTRATAEREAALTERDRAAATVNRALRQRYERLRSVKVRGMLVALEGAACGACFTSIPLNRQKQIRAGTLIDSCELCGVLLYSPETIE
jgi:predicted  nucleic acid-binding Zn-ribbon protein